MTKQQTDNLIKRFLRLEQQKLEWKEQTYRGIKYFLPTTQNHREK